MEAITTKAIRTSGRIGLITAVTFALAAEASATQTSGSNYADRPLRLPHIASDAPCPVSVGSKDVVSSAHGYIFGAGGYFFGTGPVYLGLAWKPAERAEARFRLIDRMPRVSQGYRLKTPWIMDPEYKGEALVRGARIGSEASDALLFHGPEAHGQAMVLRFENPGTLISPAQLGRVDAVWGFWPTSIVVPRAGCYALQIDTELKSDIVIFEAIQE